MIKPGEYKATLTEHTISETKSGNLQAVLTFAFDCEGPKSLRWYGGLTEAAAPYTAKTLITCGLKGNNLGGSLEIGREVQIVVENEEFEGKVRTKIKWVNPLNAVRNVVPQDLAKRKLEALSGVVMAVRNQIESSGQKNGKDEDELDNWLKEKP